MTVEVRPLGVRCNLQCQYCYQHPQRDAANVAGLYDMQKMKAKLAEQGCQFSLFGGEALLIPEADLEHLWAWGLERYGHNGIQTNGTLINANHVRMLKQYKVSVGISVDGPDELNDIRWAGNLEATRAATAKTHAAIEWLCKEELPPSLIVTLHRGNATPDKLPRMHDWFRHVAGLGVRHARLHLMEDDHDAVGRKYGLSDDENVAALLAFADLEPQLSGLQFDLFRDFRNMLAGRDNNVTCMWTGCDAYATRAVHGIEGDGQSSNCGRTNKDGVDFTKAPSEGYERYVALYHTPQEHGGCHGCRFFLMCKGNCPGTALDRDWRNRSALCGVWRRLYERFEEECLDQGVVPLSISPKRPKVERMLVEHWSQGQQYYIHQALASLAGAQCPCGPGAAQHQDANHGDRGHGDSHGDHTDAQRRNAGQPPVRAPQGHGDHTDAQRAGSQHGDAGHRDHTDHGDSGRRQ
jgi:uncharacterized protein